MEGKTDSYTRPRVLRILTRLNVGGPALHVANLAEGLKNQYDHLLVVGEVLPTEGSMDHLFADSSINWVKISDFKVIHRLIVIIVIHVADQLIQLRPGLHPVHDTGLGSGPRHFGETVADGGLKCSMPSSKPASIREAVK